MRNSTKHLLIDHINVIETKTKYGSKDIEHQHGLWIVHKDISQRLNEKFINRITQSSSFKLNDQKHRFVDEARNCLHLFKFGGILVPRRGPKKAMQLNYFY